MASDATAAAASAASATAKVKSSTEELIKEAAIIAVENREPEKEMETPKSENYTLKKPTLCPPAPKKLKPVRRKPLAELSQNKFYAVRRDLTSVFIKLPITGPPEKRIRLI